MSKFKEVWKNIGMETQSFRFSVSADFGNGAHKDHSDVRILATNENDAKQEITEMFQRDAKYFDGLKNIKITRI
jgi:hypothetical protein